MLCAAQGQQEYHICEVVFLFPSCLQCVLLNLLMYPGSWQVWKISLFRSYQTCSLSNRLFDHPWQPLREPKQRNTMNKIKAKKVPRTPFKDSFLVRSIVGSNVCLTANAISIVQIPVSACVYLNYGEGFSICFRNSISRALPHCNCRTAI